MDSKSKKISQISVLLFERDPDTIKIIQNTFSGNSYALEMVRNVLSGMNSIKTNPPDIVLINQDYPEINGTELLRKIREMKFTTPVIIFGQNKGEIIIDAFRSGASDFWTKPLISGEIKNRLDAVAKSISLCNPTAVENHIEAFEREKKELKGLLEVTSHLNTDGDTKENLNSLTDLAAEIMKCEAASIMLVNERENALEFVVTSGEKKHKLDTIKVPLGEGIAGWVAVNSKPQIVNDTKSDKRFTGKVDSESGFITRKILAVPMLQDNETIGVLEVINTVDGRDFTNDDLRILNDMSVRIAAVISATKKIENQQNYFVQTTNILVKAIEKKDIYTEGHSWMVAEYCHKIASAMGLSNNEKDDLHYGAILHDIGKLNLPSFLFNKRILNEREKEIIRQHPLQGAKILEPILLWKSVVPYVLYHHEAWDGSGYPFGRSGESIPIGARIINLMEAYSIMRSANTYKTQMTLKESILEIMRASGKQFDPGVVRHFIAILEKENSPR